jgi:hypothetical protein
MSDSGTEEPKVCRMVRPQPELADISDYEVGEAEQDETPAKKVRRVAVCGTSETTRWLVPVNQVEEDGSPSWEIWTLGTCNKTLLRQDRHFQLHDLEEGAKRWSDDYKRWLSTAPVPVYVQRVHEWIPSGVAYPLAGICKRFEAGNYLTSQIAMMIALAVYEGADEIGIWGCDLAHDAEYYYQRPCVEYWIGIARGMGITVTVPKQSDLLKSAFIYAYQTHGGMLQTDAAAVLDARNQELERRHMEWVCKAKEAEKAMHILQGAMETTRYYRHWFGYDQTKSGRDYVMQDTAIAKSDGRP